MAFSHALCSVCATRHKGLDHQWAEGCAPEHEIDAAVTNMANNGAGGNNMANTSTYKYRDAAHRREYQRKLMATRRAVT